MREAGGKLTQSSQPVTLLFEPGHFPDPIGHQPDQASRQLRHSLHEVGKWRGGKPQDPGFGHRTPGQAILLHPGKWQECR